MPKIFIVNDDRRADEKIFIVHNDSYADEKDVIVHNDSYADKKVFIVQEAWRADKKVFIVNNSWDSDPVKPPMIISSKEKENPSPILDFIFQTKTFAIISIIIGIPLAIGALFLILWLLFGIFYLMSIFF